MTDTTTTTKTAEALAAWLTKSVDWYVDGQPITMEQCIRQQCGDLALSYVQAAFWAGAQPQAEPVAADGFVLVPVEPTPAMLEAAVQAICYGPEGGFTRINGPTRTWAAMLAAAPKARPPVAQQGADAYEAVQPQIVGRYRVERRIGGGLWTYCVKAGTGTAELFIGHETKCLEVAQALQTACLDGAFMASNAALSSPPPSASQPVAQGLTDEQCEAIYNALDEFAREVDSYVYGLPMLALEDRKERAFPAMRAALSTAHPAAAEGDK
jgi:hypothetical protein